MAKQWIVLSLLGGWFLAGCSNMATSVATTRSRAQWEIEATPLNRSAAELDNDTIRHLAWAKGYRARIAEVTARRTLENTLVPFNEMMMHLEAASSECSLFARVHPDAGVREVAEKGEQAISRYMTELSLDRELYDALRTMDPAGADAGTRFMIEKTLRSFRRAGVDRPDDVRIRIAALNDEIVRLGQEFAKNTREDEREVAFDSLSDLEGLPADWLEKHPPGPDGKIRVSTRYPDYIPFMTYARNGEARKRLYVEFKNRGYPKNLAVLQGLLEKRYELAQLLGYRNWADYITEDKMIGSAENAQSFIDRISKASMPAVARDFERLLDRKRKDDPGARTVGDWEKSFYEELVKSEQFAFDSQAVRPYFNFTDVQKGLFTVTQKLFGVRYEPVTGLKLWHPDVTAWDVYEGSERIGRFYLDLHPRENKYGHAACFGYREGIRKVRLPQHVLVCNFPNPRDDRNGLALMEHDDVVTFFHEFGHLLHAIFAGRQAWIGTSGISTEWDFVEAPSQMLEEWCFDVDTLRLFARHYETGEAIPEALVQNLRRARDFGKGLQTAHQMFYAAVSLNYYNHEPSQVDTTKMMIDLQRKYSPFDYVDGTHFQCNFGHLDGYSAIYYTYMWSLVISKDLLTKFEKDGMLNTRTALKYRRSVLDPGGSDKAANLVARFLGRPYSFEAFEEWLNRS